MQQEQERTLAPDRGSEWTPGIWPLRFTHRGPVLGNGFVALVEFSGRLLGRLESEGVWVDGVNPGGFSVGAPTLAQVSLQIRDSLTAVLFDLAGEARTFDDFKVAVERFFQETDESSVNEWSKAVASIRSGYVAAPADLPIQPADAPLYVRVICKPSDQITARDNPEPRSILTAAG